MKSSRMMLTLFLATSLGMMCLAEKQSHRVYSIPNKPTPSLKIKPESDFPTRLTIFFAAAFFSLISGKREIKSGDTTPLPWILGREMDSIGFDAAAGMDVMLPEPIAYRAGTTLRFRIECSSDVPARPPVFQFITASGKIAHLPITKKWIHGAVETAVLVPKKPATDPSAKSPGVVEGDPIVKIRILVRLSKPSAWNFTVKHLAWEPGK